MTRIVLRSMIVVVLVAAAFVRPLQAQGDPSLVPLRGNPPRILAWDAVVQGDEAHELRWPVAVAAAAAEIAVADAYGSRLVVFSGVGNTWTAERSLTLPGVPLALVHDGERYLLSLRQGAGLVALEGADFKLRRLPLPADTVPGALAAARGGVLFVHDLARGEVLTLQADGSVVRKTPVAARLTALTAAPGGGFYAVFAARAEVRRYGPSGDELGRWTVPGTGPVPAWPAGVVVEPGGDLLLADRHGGRIVVLDAGGTFSGLGSRRGWNPGLLRFPAGMTQLPDGRLAVADQGNGRVQIFRRIDRERAP